MASARRLPRSSLHVSGAAASTGEPLAVHASESQSHVCHSDDIQGCSPPTPCIQQRLASASTPASALSVHSSGCAAGRNHLAETCCELLENQSQGSSGLVALQAPAHGHGRASRGLSCRPRAGAACDLLNTGATRFLYTCHSSWSHGVHVDEGPSLAACSRSLDCRAEPISVPT